MDQKYGIYAVCKTETSREISYQLHNLVALSVLYFRNTGLKDKRENALMNNEKKANNKLKN